jgi:hypothetical protein
MKLRTGLILFIAAAFTGQGQERFTTGELKGFTKSPTEHIIEKLEETPIMRMVEGSVGSKSLDKPLEGVLIEIRGPGATETLRSASSDRRGRFRLRRVPDGDYKIKATLNGFRSVVGAISVRSSAKAHKSLRIEMLHGI